MGCGMTGTGIRETSRMLSLGRVAPMRVRSTWLGVILAAFAVSVPAGPLAVDSGNKDGIYALGDEVVFAIRATAQVDLEKINVTITRDGWEKLSVSQAGPNGESLAVRFRPQTPGWYMCEASVPGGAPQDVARAGVIVSPDKIGPSMPEPNDLDAFWDARRAALAAMPLEAGLTQVDSPEAQIECFSVVLPCPQTKAVQGYYARPQGAAAGKCPAILYLRAAGVAGDWCRASVQNAVWLAEQYGAIVLDINAHGMLNGQPQEYYRNLEQGELRSYWTQGIEDKDTWYFAGMYVRVLRSIEFLAAQGPWDGRHLITIGESQGGGQALAAAGLDKRVSAVTALVPALCDLTGPVVGRQGGWPMPVNGDIHSEHAKRIIDTVRYCDNVNLAKRSRAETLVFVGLIDTTCPSPGIIAAYNNLPGSKRLVIYPHKPHTGLPPEDAWIGDIDTLRNQFIRRHIAGQ
jgi:cephalosporin-C deacetylase